MKDYIYQKMVENRERTERLQAMSPDEIAKALGISRRAVDNAYYKAVRKIRKDRRLRELFFKSLTIDK